jgi:hypothetical protein
VHERERLPDRARFERRQNLAAGVDHHQLRHWQLLETFDEQQIGVERRAGDVEPSRPLRNERLLLAVGDQHRNRARFAEAIGVLALAVDLEAVAAMLHRGNLEALRAEAADQLLHERGFARTGEAAERDFKRVEHFRDHLSTAAGRT